MPQAPTIQAFQFLPPSRLGPPSPLLADNIDPVTRDFRSLFTGADPVDDSVQVAVTTTRGSGASVLETGIRFTRSKMTEDAQRAVEGDVRLALARQVRARDIQIVGISFGGPDSLGNPSGLFDEANQTAQVNVRYRNLRALDPRVRSLQLPAKAAV